MRPSPSFDPISASVADVDKTLDTTLFEISFEAKMLTKYFFFTLALQTCVLFVMLTIFVLVEQCSIQTIFVFKIRFKVPSDGSLD